METSHQVFRVEDVDGNVKDALTSRFIGFPDRGDCGFRDEWQPKVLHAVNIHDMRAHYHDEFEEIFLVLEGSGTIYVGETPIHVEKWDTVRVPKRTMHRAVPDEDKELKVAIFFRRWG